MDVAEILVEHTQPQLYQGVEGLIGPLIDHLVPRTLARAEVLWHQRDEADELAFVISGELDIYVSGRCVGSVGASELLGEASMFGPLQTRTATVRARSEAQVLILTREQVLHLRRASTELYDALLRHALETLAVRVRVACERLLRLSEGSLARPKAAPEAGASAAAMLNPMFESHARQVALRGLEVFAHTRPDQLEALSAHLRSRMYEAGEVVLAEGERTRDIYLVANGRVRLLLNVGSSGGAAPMIEIGSGRMFGLLAAVLDTPRTGTIVADGPCWLLTMPHEVLDGLEGELGRLWREAMVVAVRAEIEDCDRRRLELEARREAMIEDAGAGRARLPATLAEPERARVRETVDAIVAALVPHRRLLPDAGACAERHCPECFGLHRDKLERVVAAGAPVHMILPAYPAKSPNQSTKVLGRLPDMAEEQSLLYLQRICDEIAAVYAPGGRVTICSDGRVFSDLVLVSDEHISAYGREIDAMIERLELRSIDVFAIEDLFELTSFEGMRDHLAVHYGDELGALRQRARLHPAHRSMYNGIHRFLFEDSVTVETDKSRSKIRKECGERAYGVIQRSNAFSRLIAECFPDALRLSIHPQPAHAAKIGVLLGTASDAWITPWHGVAVLDAEGGYHLMKREAAERLGASLIHRFGRPSHYELALCDEGGAQ